MITHEIRKKQFTFIFMKTKYNREASIFKINQYKFPRMTNTVYHSTLKGKKKYQLIKFAISLNDVSYLVFYFCVFS